ncbi:MAG: hypothetical protein ACUVSJ_13750, partial [Anaerolineae bacterium]
FSSEPMWATPTPEQMFIPTVPVFPPEPLSTPQWDNNATPLPEDEIWLWPEATATLPSELQMLLSTPEEPPVPWPTATPSLLESGTIAAP